MLVKIGWKVLIDPNNIWAQVASAKYLNKRKFLEIRNWLEVLSLKTHSGSSIVVEKRSAAEPLVIVKVKDFSMIFG